jgi:antitoxin (DNA-binding transcriptional repressor) of toxin-antitoxin stability system
MMTKTVDVRDAQLPELLSLALAGNEVILTEDDKPVARLIPVPSSGQTRVAGLNRGAVWMSEDFDEPLSDEFWTGAE